MTLWADFILAGFILSSPISLLIRSPDTPRENGCNPALPAQLCRSSGSSLPWIHHTSNWTWFVVEIIHQQRGKDSITFCFFPMTWRFCSDFFFVLHIPNHRQTNSTRFANVIEKFKLTWKVTDFASDGAASMAEAFQAFCISCAVLCYNDLYIFSICYFQMYSWIGCILISFRVHFCFKSCFCNSTAKIHTKG